MNVELAEGGRISKEWETSQEWTPVLLDSGDLLMFGSHLAHRSAANKTDRARASIYATYHTKTDGADLKTRYYADRRANFPPDHGKLDLSLEVLESVLTGFTERIPGKDYGAGVKRYAFAAPFTKVEEVTVQPQQVA